MGSRAFGWRPDLPDCRDYDQDHALIAPVTKKLVSSVYPTPTTERPVAKDLRAYCSPIEDQSTEGSCTAHAGVGLMEWVQRRLYGKHLDMSRNFLYKVSRKLAGIRGDEGCYLRTTMQAMLTFGVPPEKYWPYSTKEFDKEPDAYVYSLAHRFQAYSYYRLAATPTKSQLDVLLDHLAGGLPFMGGFTVYSSLSDDGWIPEPGPKDSVEGGHAIGFFGYDMAKKAFLIRNSWGTDWGHCLAAGTKVSLLNGAETDIAAVSDGSWVYALQQSTGRMVPAPVRRVYQGMRSDLVKITLDNEEFVICTPDHVWIRRDGSDCAAANLKVGDSLLPLYRKVDHGYERFSLGHPRFVTTHWSVARATGARASGPHKQDCVGCRLVVHHKDFDQRNNAPGNLEILWKCQHDHLHSICSETRREAMRRGWARDDGTRRAVATCNLAAYNADIRIGTRQLTDAQRAARSSNAKHNLTRLNELSTAEERSDRAVRACRTRRSRYGDDVFAVMSRSGTRNKEAISCTLKRRYAAGELPCTEAQLQARRRIAKAGTNHKVAAVEALNLTLPMYDLQVAVEGCNAFALSAGVFVHNSGYGWLPFAYVERGLADDFWALVKADFLDFDLFSVEE